ncbi:MAG: 16S rRNA (guanine(966)-N(2))-methyltransferase RsmD [Pseudomonadales bacterium]|nr:16S rRNA (guanine(966)-N(2))-methyltransferase RsmD [Pseudomonadales bacterium]
MSDDHEVRIIGGNWRSRKVSFARHEEIRPTPARIRETLFNWLRFDVAGARCLELYGGSGILSIEALSRGAAQVTVIEHAAHVCRHLQTEVQKLGAEPGQFRCINTSATQFLQSIAPLNQPLPEASQFDLIFLDPPFAGDELKSVLPLIDQRRLLADEGLIYIESGQSINTGNLPANWEIYRQKKAGAVYYCLCRITE